MSHKQAPTYIHPLFRSGVLPLASSESQGESEFGGYYSPVVDSIMVLNPTDEVFLHETAHRVFTTFSIDFAVLRTLAGITHSILFALIDTLDQQGVQLTGKTLATLRIAPPHSKDKGLQKLLNKLQSTEEIVSECVSS